MKKSSPALQGFSLLEVMISGAILLTVLTAVITAHSAVMQTFQHQTNVTQVIYIAEAQMEEILSLPSSSTHLARNVVHGPVHFDARGNPTAAASVFEVTWTVKDHPVVNRAKQVSVKVKWAESTPQSFELNTERT